MEEKIEIQWPVRSPLITSDYGYRSNPITGERQFHDGLDIISSYGCLDLLAIADGQVIKDLDFYNEAQRYNISAPDSIGRFVILSHLINGKQYFTRYCHCDRNMVTVGQSVSRGDTIAVMGNLGYSVGAPHLHFDLFTSDWQKVNPGIILPDYDRIKAIKKG